MKLRRLVTALTLGLVIAASSATSATAGVTATLVIDDVVIAALCVNNLLATDVDATLTLTGDSSGGQLLSLSAYADGTIQGGGVFGPSSFAVSLGALALPIAVGANGTANVPINLLGGLPCTVVNGRVCVVLTLLDGPQTVCAPILSNGVVIPMGTIGIVGLGLLLGVALIGTQVLYRRRRREIRSGDLA